MFGSSWWGRCRRVVYQVFSTRGILARNTMVLGTGQVWGAFPRRPNFAKRNLTERQLAVPTGYRVPSARVDQPGGTAAYPPGDPRLSSRGVTTPLPGFSTKRRDGDRLQPSCPPALRILLQRLSRPTASSSAKVVTWHGRRNGTTATMEDFSWSRLDLLTDTYRSIYTREGGVRMLPVRQLGTRVVITEAKPPE